MLTERRGTDTGVPGSFRDPCGFLFIRENQLFRQVNVAYRNDYDELMGGKLYDELVEQGSLLAHEEVDEEPFAAGAYKILRPTLVPFISYPYEWSFSQIQDAALLTLGIQKRALERGMSLKDASAYNVQFVDGRPVFIDTLSFEHYVDGKPWDAYRQFCQHFLAPLALMAYTHVDLSKLLREYIDGIPLDLASRLLPARTRWLRLTLALHIHLHARSQARHSDRQGSKKEISASLSKHRFLGLLDNLESGIRKLRWRPGGTEWAEYYDDTNYSQETFEGKRRLVLDLLDQVEARLAWDLGANTGIFSRCAAERGILTISFDIDPAAVEKNYLRVRDTRERNILPLVLDLTNPSPAIGWHNRERLSLLERGPCDVALALALIHHLAISNNLPLDHVARFFAEAAAWLVIEFVPKSDSQVRRLLATRPDIFPNYTQAEFEKSFRRFFSIERSVPIEGTERTLYLMRRVEADRS